MRVCLFTPTFLPRLGGAERDADVIVRGLQVRGHEVFVLAQDDRLPEPKLPYPVRRYRRPPSQHLWPEVLTVSLWRAHRAWRFDVVLAFYGYPNGYAASLLRRKLGFALVVSPRGADLYPNFHALRKPRVRRVIRQGYRRADRIASISDWLTDRIREEAGMDLPPVDLVPNGIDLQEHDAMIAQARARPPKLPIEKPFVLHLARVAPVKQQTLAVEAVHRLRDEFRARKIGYAIVGDGNGAQEVREQIDRYRLGDVVKMLGSRTGVEKAWLLDNAMFGVSTSREEGFGNVVLEMMATGTPMLASDIGPHRALIGDRGWGRLFSAGDVEDLGRKLSAMLHEDLGPMRDRALALRGRYHIEKMIDGYEASCLRAWQSTRG